ncbi:MAG: hypothetical protein IT460_15215 [Planctomycetes bacterium]|nr:hypothetical protein [Planctomycetota bacterium]
MLPGPRAPAGSASARTGRPVSLLEAADAMFAMASGRRRGPPAAPPAKGR